ncbi:hypothetical protein DL98DRAFT_589078 [Cadophora sp. DSE1049]|nr:hypothetical protein DL98DRAFT_589078 [Cadophora sp. DSE1049]
MIEASAWSESDFVIVGAFRKPDHVVTAVIQSPAADTERPVDWYYHTATIFSASSILRSTIPRIRKRFEGPWGASFGGLSFRLLWSGDQPTLVQWAIVRRQWLVVRANFSLEATAARASPPRSRAISPKMLAKDPTEETPWQLSVIPVSFGTTILALHHP